MNQPKYITYRGAKYEKISTLNEIKVDPIPYLPCCLIVVASHQGEYYPVTFFKNEPPKKVAEDYLLNAGIYPDPPIKVDQYSYHGKLNPEDSIVVCTEGRGAYRHIYDLAKTFDSAINPDDKEDAHEALGDALVNQINP